MLFPDPETLARALRSWRETKRLTVAQVVRNSRKKSKTPFQDGAVRKWEDGTVSPLCDRFVDDICPAYEIEDLDLFLDFTRTYGKLSVGDQVVCIRAKDLSVNRRTFNVEERFCDPAALNGNRTRIDQLILPAGHKTTWNVHSGHEYLLLLDGKVRCYFGTEESHGSNPPLIHDLEKGDAVAFPSAIFHAVENIGTADATLVVARPAMVQDLRGEHRF